MGALIIRKTMPMLASFRPEDPNNRGCVTMVTWVYFMDTL